MSDTQLKPCPFCGGIDLLPSPAKKNSDYRVYPFVRCMSCCAQKDGNNDDYSFDSRSAIAAWNTRAVPRVKPLEWVSTPLSDENFPTYTAATVFGIYTYGLDFDNVAYYGTPNSSRWFEAKNIQDARSKLQADYERRMGDIHE